MHASLKIYLAMYKMSCGLYDFILKSPLFYTALEVYFEKNLEKHDHAITNCYEIVLTVHVHILIGLFLGNKLS